MSHFMVHVVDLNFVNGGVEELSEQYFGLDDRWEEVFMDMMLKSGFGMRKRPGDHGVEEPQVYEGIMHHERWLAALRHPKYFQKLVRSTSLPLFWILPQGYQDFRTRRLYARIKPELRHFGKLLSVAAECLENPQQACVRDSALETNNCCVLTNSPS